MAIFLWLYLELELEVSIWLDVYLLLLFSIFSTQEVEESASMTF